MRSRVLLLAAVLALSSLTHVLASRSVPSIGPTDFVALGDGFTAGFQDGALHSAGQRNSYATFVAEALGADLQVPEIAEPGFPTPNSLTGLGLLIKRPGTCEFGEVDLAEGSSTGRTMPEASATNLAVPYQTIQMAISDRWHIEPGNPGDTDTFEDLVLGYPYVETGELSPSSQLETAVALQPEFVTVWLGNMDALLAVVAGDFDDNLLTPTSNFSERVDLLLDSLDVVSERGAILNVPEVTTSAFLVSQRTIRKRTGLTSKQAKRRLGIGSSDFVLISALPTVDSIASGQASGPLSSRQILTKKEVKKLRSRVRAFNQILEKKAKRLGWAYVDINSIFVRYSRDGVELPGVGRLTTDYLGGLFSLDAIHPSNTGQALIAVATISAINDTYGLGLPIPNVTAIAVADPLTCGAQLTRSRAESGSRWCDARTGVARRRVPKPEPSVQGS